jgi:glycosyltransferase involved in cell wall biosynthesis
MWHALNKIGKNFDIVLANHSLTTIPVSLSRIANRKKFYYVQAYEPEYYGLESGLKPAILRILSLLSYQLPLRQIANAPIYIGYKNIRAKEWIPPGLDREIFYRRSIPPLVNRINSITIGVVGRREPSKGISFALHAFEQLAAHDDRYSLNIAFGNLPNGWSHPRASVTVPKNDRELADFYRSIDILVAPGVVQLGACHYPVLEAMACGTPVVTTGYLPANDQNSWLVPIMNVKAITDAIKKIEALSTAERDIYLDCAEESISPFSWEYVSRNFLNRFENI